MKQEGRDITVVAISRSVIHALEAAQKLAAEGIQIEVIDPMTIKPLDEETILRSVDKTSRLMIVHEACKTGGIGGEIAAIVAEKALDSLDAPIRRVAALDTPIPFGLRLESFVLPGVEDIVKCAREMVA